MLGTFPIYNPGYLPLYKIFKIKIERHNKNKLSVYIDDIIINENYEIEEIYITETNDFLLGTDYLYRQNFEKNNINLESSMTIMYFDEFRIYDRKISFEYSQTL